MQRVTVEHLLWLTTETKSSIVPDFPDLTDPESCHKKCDHVPNMDSSSKLRYSLPIETKNTKTPICLSFSSRARASIVKDVDKRIALHVGSP
jgi:hypothetical protein